MNNDDYQANIDNPFKAPIAQMLPHDMTLLETKASCSEDVECDDGRRYRSSTASTLSDADSEFQVDRRYAEAPLAAYISSYYLRSAEQATISEDTHGHDNNRNGVTLKRPPPEEEECASKKIVLHLPLRKFSMTTNGIRRNPDVIEISNDNDSDSEATAPPLRTPQITQQQGQREANSASGIDSSRQSTLLSHHAPMDASHRHFQGSVFTYYNSDFDMESDERPLPVHVRSSRPPNSSDRLNPAQNFLHASCQTTGAIGIVRDRSLSPFAIAPLGTWSATMPTSPKIQTSGLAAQRPLDDGPVDAVAISTILPSSATQFSNGGQRYTPAVNNDAGLLLREHHPALHGATLPATSATTSVGLSTQQSVPPEGQLKRKFNMQLVLEGSVSRQCISVELDSSVDDLLVKVQKRVDRRLAGKEVAALEIRLTAGDGDTFLIERDDADTWEHFVEQAVQLEGAKIDATAFLQL